MIKSVFVTQCFTFITVFLYYLTYSSGTCSTEYFRSTPHKKQLTAFKELPSLTPTEFQEALT